MVDTLAEVGAELAADPGGRLSRRPVAQPRVFDSISAEGMPGGHPAGPVVEDAELGAHAVARA